MTSFDSELFDSILSECLDIDTDALSSMKSDDSLERPTKRKCTDLFPEDFNAGINNKSDSLKHQIALIRNDYDKLCSRQYKDFQTFLQKYDHSANHLHVGYTHSFNDINTTNAVCDSLNTSTIDTIDCNSLGT